MTMSLIKNRMAGDAQRPKDSQATTNRADEVRNRRAQRSQQRINNVSKRITNPPPSRPVIVRGSSFGRPIHQQAGTRARRQFYVTMDRAAGTELRLPAIPVIRPGWRLASGFLAILMVVGIYSLWYSPYTQVNSVEVYGLHRLSSEAINAAIHVENLSIIEVNPDQVKEKLASTFPELTDVQVNVELPNAVTVTATERQPLLAIAKGDQVSWVDASGVIFPARGDAGKLITIQAESDLPLAPAPIDPAQFATQEAASADGSTDTQPAKNPVPVTSIPAAGPQKIDPNLLAAAVGLCQQLPEGTQLVYSKANGLGWKAPEGW